jgi:hypothetical protein
VGACIPSTEEAEAGRFIVKASLGYITRSCLNKTKQNPQQTVFKILFRFLGK